MMVILTPAMAPPWASVTVPEMRPKMVWAMVGGPIRMQSKTRSTAAVVQRHGGRTPHWTSSLESDNLLFMNNTPKSKYVLHACRTVRFEYHDCGENFKSQNRYFNN